MIRIKNDNSVKNINRVFEVIYLVYMCIVVLIAYKDTTMWTYRLVTDQFFTVLRYFGIALVLFKIILSDKGWNVKKAAAALIVFAVFIISWKYVGRYYVVELAILIIGAHGIDFRKIVKVFFAVSAAATAVTIILAASGVIENLIYTRGSHIRISFGSVYPTDFTAHLFFLTACYLWLRELRITYIEIIIIAAEAVFCQVFCQARNNAVCIGILAICVLIFKLVDRKKKDFSLPGPVQYGLVGSMPFLAVLITMMSYLYDPGQKLMLMIDNVLSGRISLGKTAFDIYNVTPFGQYIYMRGWGGSTDISDELSYFYLDSSYINILFRFGALVFFVVIGIFVLGSIREKKNRNWIHMIILGVIALECFTEHHLIEIAYHPFLLMLFALCEGTGNIKGKRENHNVQ
ncbi:MAG: hypothetical protein HUJ76_04040 [Parasporobacterium sp.]|nr:hypothetical protein [Parasporobacterium sp.]